jgi:restriction system protein
MTNPRKNRSASAPRITVIGLPWWAWLGLALISYAVLHWIAKLPVPQSSMGARSVLIESFLPARAWAQYAVPVLCLLLTLLCWVRSRNQGFAFSTEAGPSANSLDLNSMGWREFEALVCESFRRTGYQFTETTARFDAATDIEMRRERQTYLLHCKHWRATKVEVDKVQAFHAAMQRQRATGGILLTSGRFSREAHNFATGINIRLIDGPALLALIQPIYSAQQARDARAAAQAAPPPPEPELGAEPELAPRANVLACPLCEAPMARRKLKRGANAGRYFWGCTRHPDCKGKRSISAK